MSGAGNDVQPPGDGRHQVSGAGGRCPDCGDGICTDTDGCVLHDAYDPSAFTTGKGRGESMPEPSEVLSGRERHFAPKACVHCGLTVLHAYMAMHVGQFHHHCEHCGEADHG